MHFRRQDKLLGHLSVAPRDLEMLDKADGEQGSSVLIVRSSTNYGFLNDWLSVHVSDHLITQLCENTLIDKYFHDNFNNILKTWNGKG